MFFHNLNDFPNTPTELTLDQFFEIIPTPVKTYLTSKQDLKRIHDIACLNWKTKIKQFTLRDPFSDTIELTQTEVDEMFKASDNKQKELLISIFGEQTKEIDLSKGEVDGIPLFSHDVRGIGGLIEIRSFGEYNKTAFHLDNTYNWELKTDSTGSLCLIPTRK